MIKKHGLGALLCLYDENDLIGLLAIELAWLSKR